MNHIKPLMRKRKKIERKYMMKGRSVVQLVLTSFLIMCFGTVLVRSEYYTKGSPHQMKEKVTHLHFYLHDILSGQNTSGFKVAEAKNIANPQNWPTPFTSVFTIDDLVTEGPEATSKVIGNAQGLYVSSGRDVLSLVVYMDFGFTTGKYNGSSISVFSRNPITLADRELAVVGGRGKFKMARGFAELKTTTFNVTSGNAIVEYKVTLFHY